MSNRKLRPATRKQIGTARRIYQNPYACLNGNGDLEAVVEMTHGERTLSPIVVDTVRGNRHAAADLAKRNFTDSQIEKMARRLLAEMWRRREDFWPNEEIDEPLKMLDPQKGCQTIGFDFFIRPDLGYFRHGRGRSSVAGIVDFAQKKIEISERPSKEERNFTAAHELGHAVMHEQSGLHRDRPIDQQASIGRAPSEQEADKFAACFLMPRKLVLAALKDRYGRTRFELDDEVASTLGAAWSRCTSRRERARFVAKHTGRGIQVSLVELFQVTVEALAIRLEELGIIPE